MLVWADGVGVADNDLLPRRHRPDTVGDDPVIGKVAAAYDIARSGCGHPTPVIAEKRFYIAVGHQLRAGFAVGVGIIAVQVVALPVTVLPLLIFINLVRGHVETGPYRPGQPDALQHINGSHDIGLVGADRIFVGIPHNGLGSQVKHNLRLCLFKNLLQMLQIPDIAYDAVHPGVESCPIEQVGACGRLLGISRNYGAHIHENPAQPGPLKPCMACDQHPPPPVKFFKCIPGILHL